MKKNILYILSSLFLLGLFTTSCTKDEDENEFEKLEDVRGGVLNIENVQKGFFDIGAPDAQISFDLSTFGETINSAVVTASFAGNTSDFTTVSGFPGTVTASLTDVASLLNLNIADLAIGDVVTFGFKSVTSGSGIYDSGKTLNVALACESTLAGDFDFTTTNYNNPYGCTGSDLTGTVTWTESGAGRYVSDDFAYGTYQECYGGPAAGWASLEYSDVCSEITMVGLDNYDDTWSITIIDVSGPSLTFDWGNTFGELGRTTLVRQDGNDWPPLF